MVQWIDFWFLLIIELLLEMDLKRRHWPLMSIIKFWVQNSEAISLLTVYFWQRGHKQPDCFMDLSLSGANLKDGLVKSTSVYWAYWKLATVLVSPATRHSLPFCIWKSFKTKFFLVLLKMYFLANSNTVGHEETFWEYLTIKIIPIFKYISYKKRKTVWA